MNFFQKRKLLKKIKKHVNRPLDICEILSRTTDENVVVDAYEYFMRKSHWVVDDRFSPCVKSFLLCVLYDGEVANGGVSQFLANSSGGNAHQIADALHMIGALEAEAILRRSFSLFSDGMVPEDRSQRNQILDETQETDALLEQLDSESFDTDIQSFCYLYLMKNKDLFLACK